MSFKPQFYTKHLEKMMLLIRINSFYLSSKSYLRLIYGRRRGHFDYSYPLLIVSGLQRSGTHLVTQLLNNHPQTLSYYSELHIGRPNKYHWPDLTKQKSEKEKFSALIPLNLAKKVMTIKSNHNFIFDFSFFKKLFLKLEKNNDNGSQRDTLNNFFTAYFNAYLNCNHSNFYDKYKFIVASVPGLTLFNESINGFLWDYPDGKLLVMIREPLLWWNSARHHSKNLIEKGLERYKISLKNTLEACSQYPNNVFVVSFDNLIKNTEKSIKLILERSGLEFNKISTYPSYFPFYGIDNSTFGLKEVKVVLNEKVNRAINIPKDEEAHIKSYIYPLYMKVISNCTINAFRT